MIERLFSPEVIYALGWTLIHALWQGALFACLLALTLIVLRRYSAQARYVVAVGLLAGFFVTTVITFVRLYSGAAEPAAQTLLVEAVEADTQSEKTAGNSSAAEAPSAVQKAFSEGEASSSFPERMVNYYNKHLPFIVTVWLLGVLVLLLRLLGQLAYVQRLKAYGVAQFPDSWQDRLRELEAKLDLRRAVQYLLSYRTDSPLTFGWLRPVVLFPVALFKTLEDTQVYAILAHELAHVKRDDFVVNLLQQLLLTLFFYHPGLWWMSARIEEEREHSCDDLAVRITKQPIGYAKTLLHLTETQMSTSSLTMNYEGADPANRKGFRARITRLLSPSLAKASYGEGIATALILVLTLGIAVSASGNPPDSSAEAGTALLETEAEQHPAAGMDAEPTADATDEIADKEIQAVFPVSEDFELFMEAIDDGNMRLVQHFLESGVDVNGLDKNGFTPLMKAASEDHPEIARLLIKKGAKVNFVNSEGWTALAEAADEGAYATAVVLLDAGADAHVKSGNWASPLTVAASEGHADILQLLIEKGAKLSAVTEGESPLHSAAEEGQLEVVQLLLKLGAAVDQPDEDGRTPLLHAAGEGQKNVVELLIQQGAKLNGQDKDGRTALSYAARERQTEVVGFLLEKGADVGLLDQDGRSALDYAAREDAGEVMKLLLATKKGAKLLQGNSSMMIAASGEGALSIIRQLVEAGADVNAADEDGRTPLMMAAREGQDQVITYLLDKGANVNATSAEAGWTPLLLAAREDQPNTLRLLLDKGADMDVRCSFQSMSLFGERNKPGTISYYQDATPLMVAVEENSNECVKLLLEKRADVNATITKIRLEIPSSYDWKDAAAIDPADTGLKTVYKVQGWTPLMEAVENENEAVIKLLLAAGADVAAKTSTGMTALSVAQKSGKSAIVQLLRR